LQIISFRRPENVHFMLRFYAAKHPIPFPVARYRATLGPCRALADQLHHKFCPCSPALAAWRELLLCCVDRLNRHTTINANNAFRESGVAAYSDYYINDTPNLLIPVSRLCRAQLHQKEGRNIFP